MKKVAIIMAGGKGTRLWPISKEELPKQFLPLVTKESMLELTVKRAMKLVEVEDIYIVTQPEYVEITKKQILNVPTCNILTGPTFKSTTEAIAFSTVIIKEKYEDAIMIILPSDHIIQEEKLVYAINRASNLANKNCIVTLGITPEFPETNYGYIEKGSLEGEEIYKVVKFTEKPRYELAEEYLKSKKYLWNSGIFVWKSSLIYQEIEKYVPDVYKEMKRLTEMLHSGGDTKEINQIFKDVQTKSIDYEILEKTSNIYVIEGDFAWTDIGNFYSLKKAKKTDENNNTIEGKVVVQDSKNNMIIAKEKSIVAVGVENLIVVETEDEILIMNSLEKEKYGDNKFKELLKN